MIADEVEEEGEDEEEGEEEEEEVEGEEEGKDETSLCIKHRKGSCLDDRCVGNC